MSLSTERANASLKREREEAKQGPCAFAILNAQSSCHGSLVPFPKKTRRCWEGYSKVPGKADYAEDSCKKNGTSSKAKKKYRKKRKSKKGSGESSTGTDTEPPKKKD